MENSAHSDIKDYFGNGPSPLFHRLAALKNRAAGEALRKTAELLHAECDAPPCGYSFDRFIFPCKDASAYKLICDRLRETESNFRFPLSVLPWAGTMDNLEA